MKISELKGKHDHALTSWLKVIIFSLLMIAPLFASISQWVYVSVNKNAKDSYSNQYIESYSRVISNNMMIDDNDYLLKISKNDVQSFTQNFVIKFNNISIDIEEETGYSGINMIQYQNSGFVSLQINGIESIYYSFQDPISNIFFGNIYFNNDNTSYYNILNDKLFIISYKNEPLDNAFYYGVEKMTQSDLFNWTQNTTLYTGIKTMTDNLEIQTPAIAILLTYWFILTIIYVIIDIVLKGFTTLTHLIMGAK